MVPGLVELYSDAFDRADGGLGTEWPSQGGGSNDFTIASNAVRGTVLADDNCQANSRIEWPNDQWAEIVIEAMTGATDYHNCGVMVRTGTAGALNGYFCVAEYPITGNGRITIGRFLAGASVGLANSGALTIVAGDRVRCEVRGNRLQAFLNDVLVLTTTDGNHAGGRPGITSYQEVALTNATIASWRAGGFSMAVSGGSIVGGYESLNRWVG